MQFDNRLIWVLAVLFFTVACKGKKDPENTPPGAENEPPELVISVVPYFHNAVFDFSESYVNLHGYRFQVQDLAFYMSNLRAVKQSGEEVPLKDILLFKIPEGRDTAHIKIEAADYTGLRFDIGVPVAMNGTEDPDFNSAIYDENSPLSTLNGMYWTWANGYRFFSFAGRFDTLPDPQEVLPIGFAFHSGMDTLFREVPQINKSFQTAAGSKTEVVLHLNIDRLFANEQDTLNLKYENAFHGSEAALPTGIQFANLTATCFTVE